MEAIVVQGKAYTDDVDYLNGLFGAPVRAVVYDWSIRQWRWVVMQPCATPRDKVGAADPDAQLGEEHWESENPNQVGIKLARLRREENLKRDIHEYLTEHGPSTFVALRRGVGRSVDTLRHFLRTHQGTLYTFHGTQRAVWGLVGQSYQRKKDTRDTPELAHLCDVLREHGPMTAGELAEVSGSHRNWIDIITRRRTDVFVVTGKKMTSRYVSVWGLKGVHQEAG